MTGQKNLYLDSSFKYLQFCLTALQVIHMPTENCDSLLFLNDAKS